MDNFIIEEISKELDISIKRIETVLNLLEEGNTIPFIGISHVLFIAYYFI